MIQKKEYGVIVPHENLSKEALNGLIEEFVSRDGTDSGYTKLSLEQRAGQVKRQLEKGTAVIVFDQTTQTANIVPKEEFG